MSLGNAQRCAMVALFAALVAGVTTRAGTWEVWKDPAEYGNLDQNLIDDGGDWACGPVSAVNSFVYLERHYPQLYGGKLVPPQTEDWDGDGDVDLTDHMCAAAAVLCGEGYMNNNTNTGRVRHDYYVKGKHKYLEEKVPGSSAFSAVDAWPWTDPNLPKPPWVQTGRPTWRYLYDQLSACKDVEGLISGDNNKGHYVTFNGLYFEDPNNNGTIDPNQPAQIHFIDPRDGSSSCAFIWDGPRGLETNYFENGWISMIMAEVPEPTSLLLLMTFGLCMRRR